ncbi:MAG: hypothetical protein AVO33_02815 [delta proteobacterium ML8_F1]|nr:MAG: hypothetical protein AVO33_02815 [delta proteobacterium ML8_F1]
MRVLFMGTPEFALPSLEYLLNHHELVGVFTQPDRKKGRGKKLSPPPVKAFLENTGIRVYQPPNLKAPESLDLVRSLSPEVIVVIAYGNLLPGEILEAAPLGAINVHASLLPALRGASPIQTAIVRGLEVTGVTTMQMNEGLDTGDILLKETVDIPKDMNAGELHDVLKEKSALVLERTLENLKALKALPQDESLASYAPMITRAMAKINFNQSAREVYNGIRGYFPWPVAYTLVEGVPLKILQARVRTTSQTGEPGRVSSVSKEGIEVLCASDILVILRVQLPSGKPLHVSQFIQGHDLIRENIQLGE